MVEAVMRLGSISGHTVADKLASVGLHIAEPRQTEAPLIEECLAWLECAVADAFQVGDHTLFVGEVLAAQVEEEAFDQTWLLTDDDARPLHHLGSDLFAVLREPFAAH
jgi:flavin reductase (DIM6/NTAB) family NADH-FMN oxidoreductase RutF